MNFATATHIGYVREENQDCVEIRTFPDGVLALVCDGMGGERYGKEASTRATEIFLECMEERCQEPMQTYEIRNGSGVCRQQCHLYCRKAELSEFWHGNDLRGCVLESRGRDHCQCRG